MTTHTNKSPTESTELVHPALRYKDQLLRKQAWQQAQELAAQWRTTQNPLFKTAAASLLYDLMASEAMVIIKTKKVDAKLPTNLRRDYPEMAGDVAISVLSHNYSRFTAILEKHDPEKASLQTMVARYLSNKVIDHLRADPLPGHFPTVGKKARGAKPGANKEDDEASGSYRHANPRQAATTTLSSPELDAPEAATVTPTKPTRASSLLSDEAPGLPSPPQDEFLWDTVGELCNDLVKILDLPEQNALWYDTAGYTAAEASAALGISESTYKRRLKSARERIEAYFELDDWRPDKPL